MAVFTLICRIIFARLYVPHLPVDDGKLPFITVIIPVFNEGQQVLRTVHSIMASEYPPDKMQVICVDDGSQGDTWLWMIEAKHAFGKRVKLMRHHVKQGKRLSQLRFRLILPTRLIILFGNMAAFPSFWDCTIASPGIEAIMQSPIAKHSAGQQLFGRSRKRIEIGW